MLKMLRNKSNCIMVEIKILDHLSFSHQQGSLPQKMIGNMHNQSSNSNSSNKVSLNNNNKNTSIPNPKNNPTKSTTTTPGIKIQMRNHPNNTMS